MNHERGLQAEYEKQKLQAEVSEESQGSVLIIFPTEKKNDSLQLWQKRVEGLECFLNSFKKVQIKIPAELFDEITRRWREERELTSIPGTTDYLVSFIARLRCVEIIGKTSNVEEEQLKFNELVKAAERDTELMKSIVEVEERDITRGRLTLLKMSGICEKLQKKHQHLTIWVDLNSNRLRLKGPTSVLQEARLEVYQFISKIIEQTLELPPNVINVLKKPPVSKFTQDLLKEREILALFEAKSSKEIQVVGVGSKYVADAERVLQNATQELSLPLTPENALVLESSIWKDYQLKLTSTLKIGIISDLPSSTLWVSGIAEDVKECFGRIEQFLEENTILYESLPMDQGTTRFIFEKWGSKLERLKNDLADCCLDMRPTATCDGIKVSGTAKGLKKCLPKLKELLRAVQKDSVPIEKPGMKKFILQGKGPESLRAIEDRNHCVILLKERNEQQGTFIKVDPGINDLENSSSKFMCSYLTIEGKNISVLKGDLTKHKAEAIVNAANSQLNHVGGLAAAIVKAGGQEIQNECDDFIRDKGILREGNTVVTTAGGLPCDKVIHTVGPQWNRLDSPKKKEKKERVLHCAITNCLMEAKSLRSIAIPAVSSGVYGFPRDLCAKIILDAVVDFCTTNPACSLLEIHLVNNDDLTVTAFVEEMRKRLTSKHTFIDNEKLDVASSCVPANSTQSKPTPRPRKRFTSRPTFIDNEKHEVASSWVPANSTQHKPTPRPRESPGQSPQGIRITVKVNDLAKEKVLQQIKKPFICPLVCDNLSTLCLEMHLTLILGTLYNTDLFVIFI